MQKYVAIQFFGHLRSFKKTFKTFKKNIVIPNEKRGITIDIFIHTWDELEHTDIRTHYKMDKNRTGKPLTEKDLNWIRKNYNPKEILIEKQQPLTEEETNIAQLHNIHDKISKNMALTFYQANALRVNNEKKQGIKYDCVLVTRPDIIFYEELNLSKIFEDFNISEIENTVFFSDIPQRNTPNFNINFKKFICGIDLFLLGGGDAISKISDGWYKEKRYLTHHKAEDNIAQLIDEKGINLNLIQYPTYYCWNIKRTNEIKDKFFSRPFVFILNTLDVVLHPILIYSTSYQKRTFIGGYESLSFSKKIFRSFLRLISCLVPVKSWRRKIRGII